jgi:hydroxypyruvate reductase
MEIIERYGLAKRIPSPVIHYFTEGLCNASKETPKENDPVFDRVQNCIIANNIFAMHAAREKAKRLGYRTLILSSQIEGNTRDVALVHAGIFKEVVNSGNPISSPACILSGGETTVTLLGQGLGGRNQEFCLALALHIQKTRGFFFLSAGTDGSDGPTDAAGAFVDGETIERATRMGMDARAYLADNNSYPFFERLGDLFKTGPTNTNVMDLRICIIV